VCGIAGFVDPAAFTPDPREVLARMRDSLAHRGPDDRGSLALAPAWLGHRRLAVVDAGSAGRQPFVLADERGGVQIAAIANAEIYNHLSLRDAIRDGLGERSIGASDCAILPSLYALYGTDAPRHLSGMYALAIWDARERRLVLARDRGGEKPLYYARLLGGGLAFASEVRALLLHPAVRRDVDPVALRRYLTYDYVPGSRTIYQGIERLPPGTTLVWEDGRIALERHAAEAGSVERAPLSFAAAVERLWQALASSVAARLMSDVPLGVLLSGGLDSTALVAAVAAREPTSPIRTFCMGFAEAGYDESWAARQVAAHFGTEHHEVRIGGAEVLAHLPAILAHLDEPFADGSFVPMWLLSRFVRGAVTVVLDGAGGDELFLGYPTFTADPIARALARLPASLRRVLVPLASAIPPSERYASLADRARRLVSTLDLPADHRHPAWIGSVPPRWHQAALASGMRERAIAGEVFADLDALAARFERVRPGAHRLEHLSFQYLETYLAEGVLTKVDRASMAHGLEVRAPFLDHGGIDLAFALPVRHKRRGLTGKRVLRAMLAGRVPRAITSRPKHGFAMPIGAWLRGPLAEWMQDLLTPGAVARDGLLSPAWTSGLMAAHLAGEDHAKALWSALVLTSFCRGAHGPGARC